MLEKGYVLDSRYEVISQIGQGGMSYVYKALDTKLNRYVALKVLKEEFSTDEEFVQKFRQEAQSVASLVHPNIVAAYDAVDEGELHYIVMELVEGRSLKVRIQHRGLISNDSAIEIALQTAEGIAAAHKNGIIHRDIKPQNILLSRDGTVKVADFGIAKAVTGETISTAVLGSAHYVSPEQAKKGVSDARSDIYSLGITMYEMVTGTLPFDGDNTVSVVMAHINKPMVPPEQLNPDLYPALNDIILKATRKNPADRYQTAEEMIADLKRCAQEPDGDFVFPDEPEGKTGEAAEQGSHKRTAEAGKKKSAVDRKVILTLVGIALLLIVVILSVFLKRSSAAGEDQRETLIIDREQAGLTGGESIEITEGRVMKDLIGKTEEEAKAIANEDLLKLTVQSRIYSDTYAAGIVIDQNPEAGSDVKTGDTVFITVSLGSELDSVLKSLKGKTTEEAIRRLTDVEVSVLGIEYKFSNDVPEGCVIGYIANDDPNEEASAAQNEGEEPGETKQDAGGSARSIRLLVSAGMESEGSHMPSLIGLQVSEAASVLESNGLRLGSIDKVPEGGERTGLITAQSEAPDTPVKKGTAVNVRVNWEPGDILSYELTEGLYEEPDDTEVLSPEFWYGSVDNVYTVGTATGPSGQSSIENIGIRLHQRLDDNDEYSVIAEPRPISGGTRLPVSYRVIRGAKGVARGIVEVYDADTDEILQSYEISFYPPEQ